MKNLKLIFFIALFLFSCNAINRKNIMQYEYEGIIINKYQDIPNHNSYCFSVKVGSEKITELADLYHGSFEYADVGDSISKVKGEFRITIFKKNGEYKSFHYSY